MKLMEWRGNYSYESLYIGELYIGDVIKTYNDKNNGTHSVYLSAGEEELLDIGKFPNREEAKIALINKLNKIIE